MQHKGGSAGQRWALLLMLGVVAFNLYWAASVILAPLRVNAGLVAIGLLLQAVGIAGVMRKLPGGVQRHVPSVIFMLAVLFGLAGEWLGLFHGNEQGRVSPSIWAPSGR